MNKKLVTIAVAGALAAPALALAQTASVSIYGLLNAEYGFARQPDNAVGVGRHSVDSLGSGASRFGFRGEEKLSGGTSAWFQCESDFRFLSGSTRTSGSICDRNSALGLKGGFGNFFVGTWDTPIKTAVGKVRMLNETGWTGAQHLLLNGNAGGQAISLSNRNSDSVNYETPNFSGFQGRVQITSTKAAENIASTNNNVKGRDFGIGGDYSNGPLLVALGYSRRDDNMSQIATAGSKDTVWAAGVNYTFGALKGGVTYTDTKIANGPANTNGKRKSWNLALQYTAGVHSIMGGYTLAGDYKGSSVAVGTEDNGAKQWQIGYNHAMSKRTNVGVTYARLTNDRFGVYNLTPLSQTNTFADQNASVFNLYMNHTF